tara:strand:+ start:233726 stop:234277 length:552 start_codon:yes stop_codon:yes gene_type:complete
VLVRVVETEEFMMTEEDGVLIPEIRVKKLHPDAKLPEQNTDTDAGYDLVAIGPPEKVWAKNKDDKDYPVLQYIQYRTGIAIQPPRGYHVEIFPRSSISKHDLVLANSIGLVDEGYRGELLVRFKYIEPDNDCRKVRNIPMKIYQSGDKIAQLVVRKTQKANFVLADELSETDRGTGGFGSSGR